MSTTPEKKEKGKIYLIPTPLAAEAAHHTIPPYVAQRVESLNCFIVERAKTARHFIRAMCPVKPLGDLEIFELNTHSEDLDFKAIAARLRKGENIGLMSEAGCPAVADPGSTVVAWAHREGFETVPMVGPSSLLLALMGSGMNGQGFTFGGYLPAKRDELARKFTQLEEAARRTKFTQIFIEAPYRNKQFIETAVATLHPNTRFCIAADLTTPQEFIATKTVGEWRKSPPPDLHKHTVIFLFEVP
jgi:16S rRNA (cytidine1402-2'-O)-methyltransferase